MSIENLFVEDIQDSYLEKGELMSKVSLFFGAGAEIGYGLPSGGNLPSTYLEWMLLKTKNG